MIIDGSPTLPVAILLGFAAQTVGSSLGMAYSLTSSSVLLAMGLPPAMVSASVHASEVVNRLFSGISHFRFGNVDGAIFRPLALFGALGAFSGAFVITASPAALIRPLIAALLLCLGGRILLSALRSPASIKRKTNLAHLGFVGGFVDVIGGGGWGAVVTSTLILRGNATHMVIGSINFAKFFVAIIESVTLAIFLKSLRWDIIAGLIIGGVLAAPLAAWSCRRTPPRILTFFVGALVCCLSLNVLLKALK
jgi:uncharacterized membrane protein YfcA